MVVIGENGKDVVEGSSVVVLGISLEVCKVELNVDIIELVVADEVTGLVIVT